MFVVNTVASILASLVAVPSVVMTVIMVSVDNGLVRVKNTITDPWLSLTCIDGSLKHIFVPIKDQQNIMLLYSIQFSYQDIWKLILTFLYDF